MVKRRSVATCCRCNLSSTELYWGQSDASNMQAKIALLGVLGTSQAFYLPGVAPVEYSDGARVDLKVNKLTSVKTQLPYDYYTLPFCKPVSVVQSVENLGEILAGDLIENSPYDLRMGDNQNCKLLCKQELKQADKDQFRARIDDEYMVNMIVDNLPAATKYIRRSDGNDYMCPAIWEWYAYHLSKW
eukprot:s296_g9.t1